MKTFLVLILLSSSMAGATQTFKCTGNDTAKNKLAVTLKLENETSADIGNITASSVIKGFYKESSKYGVGLPSTIKTDAVSPTSEDQVEGKPAITVWTEEARDSSVIYTFTFSREILGVAFENRKVNGWIDPDAPEGGGYPLDLRCSSKGSQ
jgi:hypothetical protein